MSTITSLDGTTIAFDKVGSGPAVILINGAMSYRAFDPTLAQLADLLSEHFTVYNYDRRGRGESGNTHPFTKNREIEDVQAMVADADGTAMLFGISSGGAIALETAAVTPGVTKVFVYEVPFIVDDGRAPLTDYAGDTARLVADGKIEEVLEYFMTQAVGMPAEFLGGMKEDQGMWGGMIAIAPTIAHDAAFMGDFMKGKLLPEGYWSKVKVPVLVADGGGSDAWMGTAATALNNALPDSRRVTLADQTHMVDPTVLAPVMIDFLGGK